MFRIKVNSVAYIHTLIYSVALKANISEIEENRELIKVIIIINNKIK